MGLLDEEPGAAVGTILADKYRIEREIANGGQGVVVLARHLRLPQLVAIKLPRRLGQLSPEARARMLREARAAFRIRSAHVAKVLDVEVLDGMPFIVMEYLVGEDLATVLAGRGPLPIAQAVGCVLQACEALAEAHQLGIVHRDIKPSNLFQCSGRTAVPLVKVLDFGLSKAIESVSDDASFRYTTEAMRIMGSARYMSPEQATGSPEIDHRTDIWSIGAVLYELIAGVPAFAAPTRSESLAKVLAQEPPPLSSVRPDIDVPPELEATISRCLQKPADLRFASIQDLVEALAPHAPRWAMSNVARVRATGGMSVAPDMGFEAAARALRASEMTTKLARPTRPRRRLQMLVAAVAIVALAGAIRRLIPPGRAAADGPASIALPVAAPAPAPAPAVVSASIVAPVPEPAADERSAPSTAPAPDTRTASPTAPPAPRRPVALRARARRSEPAVRGGAPVGNVRKAALPPPIDPLEGRR